jgi:hypothetical protein
MLFNLEDKMVNYGSGYSNWAMLMMDFLNNNYEVVICGVDALTKLRQLQQNYYPQLTWAGSENENEGFPFLKSRFIPGKTLIYVCENNTCQLPVEHIAETKNLLGK